MGELRGGRQGYQEEALRHKEDYNSLQDEMRAQIQQVAKQQTGLAKSLNASLKMARDAERKARADADAATSEAAELSELLEKARLAADARDRHDTSGDGAALVQARNEIVAERQRSLEHAHKLEREVADTKEFYEDLVASLQEELASGLDAKSSALANAAATRARRAEEQREEERLQREQLHAAHLQLSDEYQQMTASHQMLSVALAERPEPLDREDQVALDI